MGMGIKLSLPNHRFANGNNWRALRCVKVACKRSNKAYLHGGTCLSNLATDRFPVYIFAAERLPFLLLSFVLGMYPHLLGKP